jgi:hypothetical protein
VKTGFDLDRLIATPDVRCIAPVQARIVGAMRYTHVARQRGRFGDAGLVRYLGSTLAIRPFLVFIDEVGHAWPDPVCLNQPCQALLSYDEMLIVDLAAAAANGDRRAFDHFLEDMLSARWRDHLWHTARRFMRSMSVPAGDA